MISERSKHVCRTRCGRIMTLSCTFIYNVVYLLASAGNLQRNLLSEKNILDISLQFIFVWQLCFCQWHLDEMFSVQISFERLSFKIINSHYYVFFMRRYVRYVIMWKTLRFFNMLRHELTTKIGDIIIIISALITKTPLKINGSLGGKKTCENCVKLNTWSV